MNKDNSRFFQPIISVFGLSISLITTVLPLFNDDLIRNLFVNPNLAKPLSFIAFIIGIAVIWLIWQFHPYPRIVLKKKINQQGLNIDDFVLEPKHIMWILVVLIFIISITFIFIGNERESIDPRSWISYLQGLLYLLFFIKLIALFAFLFIQTKLQFEYEEKKDLFPVTVFQTLERYRLIKPSIEIYVNKQIMGNENIGPGLFRQMKVVVTPQTKEVIEFIISNDGRDIVEILRKQNIDK